MENGFDISQASDNSGTLCKFKLCTNKGVMWTPLRDTYSAVIENGTCGNIYAFKPLNTQFYPLCVVLIEWDKSSDLKSDNRGIFLVSWSFVLKRSSLPFIMCSWNYMGGVHWNFIFYFPVNRWKSCRLLRNEKPIWVVIMSFDFVSCDLHTNTNATRTIATDIYVKL